MHELSDADLVRVIRNGPHEIGASFSENLERNVFDVEFDSRGVRGRIQLDSSLWWRGAVDPRTILWQALLRESARRNLRMSWKLFEQRFASGLDISMSAPAIHSQLSPGGFIRAGQVMFANSQVPPPEDDSNETATARFDRRSRLHSVDNLPAVEYSDGRQEWYWHGVEVPKHVVCEPHLISAKEIDDETNTEVRRIMIERYPGGLAALIQAQGAKLRHKDETGELWVREMINPRGLLRRWNQREDVAMIKVKNSSPEPDGTFKDYWLRVPPETQTAREGVAWTFRMLPDQYKPEVET